MLCTPVRISSMWVMASSRSVPKLGCQGHRKFNVKVQETSASHSYAYATGSMCRDSNITELPRRWAVTSIGLCWDCAKTGRKSTLEVKCLLFSTAWGGISNVIIIRRGKQMASWAQLLMRLHNVGLRLKDFGLYRILPIKKGKKPT